MAIAYDATSQTSSTAWSSGSSLTWSHTTTGSDRYLIVAISIGDSSSDVVTGITYNGVAMTRIATQTVGGASDYMYGLVNPTTGANNIIASFSITSSFCHGAATSYTGIKQTGQPDSFSSSSASATSLSVSTTTVADNSWVVGFFSNSSANTNSRTGITSRSYNTGIGRDIGDSNAPKTPAGSYTMTEQGATSGTWTGIIASLSPTVATTTNSAMMAFF